MLRSLEGHVVAALEGRLGDVALREGPGPEPQAGPPVLAVEALEWRVDEEAPEPERTRAALQAWAAAERLEARRFRVVGAGGLQLAELRTDRGRLLIRGEDYSVEGDGEALELALYRPLPEEESLRALLSGGPARGAEERRDCTLKLRLAAWAGTRAEADELLGAALGPTLQALVELPDLEAAWNTLPLAPPVGSGVRARLTLPRASLRGISRGWSASGRATAEARLELRGALELSVAVGAPAPTGVMRRIETAARSPRSDGSPRVDEAAFDQP